MRLSPFTHFRFPEYFHSFLDGKCADSLVYLKPEIMDVVIFSECVAAVNVDIGRVPFVNTECRPLPGIEAELPCQVADKYLIRKVDSFADVHFKENDTDCADIGTIVPATHG